VDGRTRIPAGAIGPQSHALRSHAMAGRLLLAAFLDREGGALIEALCDWVRIPSVSAQPLHAGDVERSARWCAERMLWAGLEHVELLPTDGHPAVYADWLHAGEEAWTVLVYGHHDVQPVDPLDEWHSPPFEPVVRDGRLFGRGAVDDKGQVLLHLGAVRGALGGDGPGRLPVNLKVVVEGEEEIGSPHFEALLERERDRLACDFIVVSDSSMWGPERPTITMGMRGLVAFDVTLRTGQRDLHSGRFGGAVPNAAHWAARMVADLHDGDGRVTVPGFYDAVRPLLPAERESFSALGFDEAAWAATAGVGRLEGEAGFSTLERIWARPTCDVTGLTSGYGGDGVKTIVPASARFKVTFRLVADQEPEAVGAAFETWARDQVPDGIDLALHQEAWVGPALTDVSHPGVGALARAVARVWGAEPRFTRTGGSGPEEALGRLLKAPVLYLGIGLPDDHIHAADERIVLDQLWKGVLAAGELWRELAELR
jgi:acetylornithine deacetylase/succinyl-diaminopimelate desuccinylase-like protein